MITVNLFDDTFRHDVCSVAGKTPRHVRYVRDQLDWDGITLFVDGYVNRPEVQQVSSRYKVGWLHEPPCLHPENYEYNQSGMLDLLLTYYAPLLERSGTHFAPYGGVWLPRTEWGLRPKTKLCSFLIGTKTATEGHRLRQEVADALGDTVDYFGARGTPTEYGWQAKRDALADYAFSIIIETCRLDGEFTEILLDALAVGTIPIFWGADDIGNYFDERGIIRFGDPDFVPHIVRGLNFNLYRSLLPYAAANLREVSQYEVTEDWIYEHVLKELA